MAYETHYEPAADRSCSCSRRWLDFLHPYRPELLRPGPWGDNRVALSARDMQPGPRSYLQSLLSLPMRLSGRK